MIELISGAREVSIARLSWYTLSLLCVSKLNSDIACCQICWKVLSNKCQIISSYYVDILIWKYIWGKAWQLNLRKLVCIWNKPKNGVQIRYERSASGIFSEIALDLCWGNTCCRIKFALSKSKIYLLNHAYILRQINPIESKKWSCLVKGERLNLSNCLDIRKITSQIVASCWQAINIYNHLRLLLKCLKHFKRYRLVEQVCAVWLNCAVQKSNVVSFQRIYGIINNIKISRLWINSIKSY